MASLDILCSNHLNLKNKITKIEHKKIFCGPSKILKNISWPINICQKYFMNPTKTLRPPTPTYLIYGPLSACADELLSLPKITMIFPNSRLAKGKVAPAPNLMSGYSSRSAFLTATNKQSPNAKSVP